MFLRGSSLRARSALQWVPLGARLFLHRLSLYLLPASVLLCTFLGLQARRVFADQSGVMVISEVMWMGSDVSTADEWLEIACVGSGTCDLSGWVLTSAKSTGEEAAILSFATGTTLVPGDVRIVSHYAAAASRLAVDPWIATTAMSLPNLKLLLRLRDATGAIRDEVDDGIGNPFAGANPSGGAKASMERIDLTVPGNLPENWRTSTESNGFDPGSSIFGTPGVLPQDRSREGLLPSSASSESASSSESSASSDSSVSSSANSESSSASSGTFVSSESSLASLSSLSSSETSSTSQTSVTSSTSTSSGSGSSSLSSSATSVSFISSPSVLITEVLSNPLGADTEEWIEVGNLGENTVNIAGWILDDGNSTASYLIPARNASGFLLAPGEHASFRKSVTHLTLDNSGERVSLMSGALLIDAWSYPETKEEVSYGRDPEHPEQFRPFCVPTEGRANTADALAPRIVIQDAGSAEVGSAFVMGREHVSLNLTAEVGVGSLASANCLWDFDDDAVSTSCNPPSHTFADPGDFSVRLTVRDFCGELSVSTLSVTVLPEEENSSIASPPAPLSHATPLAAGEGELASAASMRSSSSAQSSIVLMSMMEPVRVETGVIVSEVYPSPPTPSPSPGGGGNGRGEEWIELFNPTDHVIDLGGWILDDLKDGGSKPWTLPSGTTLTPGKFRVFSGDETKLKLNDSGDDVWLIAPDGTWSEHITVPRLKAGTSFGLVGTEWCLSDPTPGDPNACRAGSSSSASTRSAQTKKSSTRSPAKSPFPTRYVITGGWPGTSASGAFVLTGSQVDLPPALVTAGSEGKGRGAAEAGAVGGLSLLGVVMVAARWRGLWQTGKMLLKL